LTKIMTALVVLSSARLDDVVEVPREAPGQIGSNIGLVVGERLTVRDMLYGMLLPSANDAAVALARFVRGSVAAFVDLMNATAARMGLRDTHFASPTGLDNSGYSTARDLAALTRGALQNETFSRIVSTVRRKIPGPHGTIRRLVNRNILLRVYPGAIGVKSGFTTPAGFCLIGAARLNGFGLLAIVLGSRTNAFDETIRLLNYGFGAFELVSLVVHGEPLAGLGPVTVGGTSIDVVAAEDVTAVVKKGEPRAVSTLFLPDPDLGQGVVAGRRVGSLQVFLNGRLIQVVPALAILGPTPARPPQQTLAAALARRSPVLRVLLFLMAVLRTALNAFL
jgi:serine-type D-Ala-D-Ala carboxypeptidase (penicillin-binding protein 5/6)